MALLDSIRAASKAGFDYILPRNCQACDQATVEGEGLCASCWTDLKRIEAPYCRQCGLPFAKDLFVGEEGVLCGACAAQPPAYGQARAALVYNDLSRKLVIGLKHGGRLDMVRPMAAMMQGAGADLIDRADILIPVPIHPTRLLKRRFNQAADLARQIAKRAGKPISHDLIRKKPTPPQSGSPTRRARNVQGAFEVRDSRTIAGRSVLLIDDVMTTGATVNGCAKAMLRAGAIQADVLCFARVVRDE